MNRPSWLTNLLKDLKREGKLPVEFTGKLLVTVNVSQGGIQDAELTMGEKIR